MTSARRLTDEPAPYEAGRQPQENVRRMDEHRERFVVMPVSVLRRQGLSHGAIILYGLLRDYCRDGDTCWPSISSLSSDLGGVHRNTVHTYLEELVGASLMTIERRGLGRANVYHCPEMCPKRPKHAQPPVHNYALPTVHNDEYALSTVHPDAQPTVHGYKEEPHTKKHTGTTPNGVGADAPPPPAQNHGSPAPPSRSKRAPKQRDPDAPGQAAFAIAQALIEARGEDLEVARKRGALGKYLKQVDALIIGPYAGKGLTAKKVCACIAYLLTEPRFQDADGRDRFSPALLAEKLGPWLAAKEPARYVDPAKRPRSPKPVLAPPPPPEPGSWQERVQAAQAEKVRQYRAEMRAQGIDLPEWNT